MSILKIFGFGIIWCIFGCGCVFNQPRQINFENKTHYYASLHTEAQINKIDQEKKGNWQSAKQSNIDANKYWKAYLVARRNSQRDDSLRNSHARQK